MNQKKKMQYSESGTKLQTDQTEMIYVNNKRMI